MYLSKLCRQNKVMAPLKTRHRSGSYPFRGRKTAQVGSNCSRCCFLQKKKMWCHQKRSESSCRGLWLPQWVEELFGEGVLRVAAEIVNEIFNTCAGTNSCTESQQPACRSGGHNLEENFLGLEKGSNSLGHNILWPLYLDVLFWALGGTK